MKRLEASADGTGIILTATRNRPSVSIATLLLHGTESELAAIEAALMRAYVDNLEVELVQAQEVNTQAEPLPREEPVRVDPDNPHSLDDMWPKKD